MGTYRMRVTRINAVPFRSVSSGSEFCGQFLNTINNTVFSSPPPLPNTPSWRGAQLKHRDTFTFTKVALM